MGSEPGIPDAARDLRAAIEHLEQAVRLSPANARYSGLLGEAWLLQGDPEAGLAPLQNSLQQETHPRIASLMAMALLRLDRPADAARIATEALEAVEQMVDQVVTELPAKVITVIILVMVI